MTGHRREQSLVRVTVSLAPQDYARFEALARREERSTAWMIRKAMKSFLSNEHLVGAGNAQE